MKDSTRFFIAGTALALPSAIGMAGDQPPVLAMVVGVIAVAAGAIGGWLSVKEILAEEQAKSR